MGGLGGVGVRGPMTPPPFLKIIQLFYIHVVSYQENRPPTWPKSYPSDPPPIPLDKLFYNKHRVLIFL